MKNRFFFLKCLFFTFFGFLTSIALAQRVTFPNSKPVLKQNSFQRYEQFLNHALNANQLLCKTCSDGFRYVSLNDLNVGQRKNPAARGSEYGCVPTEELFENYGCPIDWEKEMAPDFSSFRCFITNVPAPEDERKARSLMRQLHTKGIRVCNGLFALQESNGGISLDENGNRYIHADVTCQINILAICGNSACGYENEWNRNLSLTPRETIYFCFPPNAPQN